MKLWIAAALLAAGCYREAAPQSPPPEPRPATEEARPTGPVRAHQPPAPARTTIGDAIAKMREFTDDICACTDPACAQAVSTEMERWVKEMEPAFREAAFKPTDEEQKEMMTVAERMARCMTTAMSAGPPPSSPTP